jgi:hypothetical protein
MTIALPIVFLGWLKSQWETDSLTRPHVPTPTHAERARTVVAQLGTGTLRTMSREPSG